MTKLLRLCYVLLIGFLGFLSQPIFGQVSTSPCVGDTIAPVFERCPRDVFVETTTASCAVAQWPTPLAFDNCGISRLVGSYQPGTCFNLGITPVLYTASDSAGNKSICSFLVVVNPAATDTSCVADTIKPFFTLCPTNLTIISNDSCVVARWVAPAAVDNCSNPTIVSNFTSGMCFGTGTTPVVYTATDAKGNSSTCSFTVTVNRPNLDSLSCTNDTIKPRFVNCPLNAVLTISPNSTGILDSCLRVQFPSPTAVDNCSTPSVSSNIASGTCLPIGTSNIVFTAKDANGNTSTCSFTVTVVRPNLDSLSCTNDTIKPRFVNCPLNAVLTISPNSTGVLDSCLKVQFPSPTAVDNCSTPSVSSNIASGTCLPIGTSNIVFTAKDANGNTSTCSFTVTVNRPNLDSLSCTNDTIKPRFVNCPLNAVLTISPNSTGVLDSCLRVQFPSPTAVDNCSTPSVSSNIASGTCLPIGTSNIVFTAKDANGNTSTCSFTVTVNRPNLDSLSCVNDTIKPRFVNCPLNAVLTISPNSTGVLDSCLRVQFPSPTAVDNCSTPSVSSNIASGTCLPIGTSNIVFTAKDANGNTSTCSFTVTVNRPNLDSLSCVNDTIKPRFVNCPLNAVLTISPNSTGVLDSCLKVQFPSPTAVDNCSTPAVSSNIASGTCLPIGTSTIVFTAKDANGNTSTCSFTVTVVRPNLDSLSCVNDTIKPRFVNCPLNAVLTISPNSTGVLDSCLKVQFPSPTAVDNCSTPSVSSNIASGTCLPIGTSNIVFTAKDANGNTSTCSFTVTVNRPNLDSLSCTNDTIKPRFVNCPLNAVLTISPNSTGVLDSCLRVQFPSPTAVDNCSTPSVSSNIASGTCLPIGTSNIVFTAKDANGNTSTCSFTVTVNRPNLDSLSCVNDTIKPRFVNCPLNTVLTLSPNSIGVLDSCLKVQWAVPTAVDNCSTPSVLGSHTPGSCFKVGTTEVIYYAKDAKSNIARCSFTITVTRPNLDSLCATDTIKPRFTICPQSKTITSLDSCVRVSWDTPVAVDNCGIPTVSGNAISGTCFRAGATTVTYTAKDAKGNSSVCTFTITVSNPCATDTIKPRFTFCPANIAITSLDTCARAQWSNPTASDNCSTPKVLGNFKSGDCFKTGTTAVTYTATDLKGNTSVCSFTVTVTNPCASDTVKPRFVNCPTNKTLTTLDSCARIQWTAPTAVDNCSPPSVTSNVTTTTCFPVGVSTVVYTATDAKGNKTTCSLTVTVINPCYSDTIKPRFTSCPTNRTISSTDSCTRVSWNTPAATDNCTLQKLSGDYKSGDCFKTGTTVVTYTATDAKGNSSICSFTVTVVNPCATDTTKPRFVNCPTNKTLTTFDSCARIQWSTPTAIDNCSNPTVTSSVTSTTCFPVGVSTVTYTATDAKGNKSTCSLTVTVINPCFTDTIKPRFTSCPTNKSVVSLDSCAKVTWNNPTAYDNCTLQKLSGDYKSGNCFKTGTTLVTYTATDAKGNTSICSFTVTVTNPCANDTIKPVFSNCPSNITVSTSDTAARVTWRVPTATDNCGVKTLTASHQPGATFKIGTTTVTYAATDAKGNTGYCTFTVTVNQVINPCATDTVKPVFVNCPANISVSTASLSAIAQWTKPTATDNCSTPSVTSTVNSGASFPVGTTPVVYTAKDAKNNTATCSFSVTVTKEALVIDSTKCYILVARSSKKVLSFGSTAAAADAIQWTYIGGSNQKWAITTADSNSVNLTVKSTNMNLDTRWGALTNGSRLMQWTKSTGTTQKWQLVPTSDGYYKVINKGSGRALSVNGGTSATADGTLLVQQDYTGLTSQQWSIEAVPCTSGTVVNLASNDVLEVNAQPELHRARIEWVDNTGYKNDYYELEKLNTTSGKFESLSIINNKVFDNQWASQTAYDETPTEGDNFYRVKVVYLDSLTKVSPVQKVNFSSLNTVKIFPNPASDFVDIDLSTFSSESVNIDLYNGFGQKVAGQTVQKGKDSVVHFDISEQQSGHYLIRITAQGKRDVTKQLHIVR